MKKISVENADGAKVTGTVLRRKRLAGADMGPPPSHALRRGRRLCAGLAAFLLLGLPEAQAVVPINGRHQELDFTGAQVRAIAAASYAERLAQFKREGILDRDVRLFARVRRVAGRLIAQAVILKPQAAHWAWEVHVVNSPQIDAYCMAGGKIIVSAAFVHARQLSDGELAALLGHEIAHAIAEHVREQLSAVRRLDPAYAHLGPEDVANVMGWDLSVSLQLAGLSRLQELEADDIGIYLAAKSGFNPQALVGFYRKLTRIPHGQRLIDTHGSTDSRMRVVENFAAYAEVVYQNSAAHRTSSFALQ